MPEIINPTVVIEGRTPLPNQLVTRQTYLPTTLAAEGVQTFFVDAANTATYDASGRIHSLDLAPGQYAWRLRDITWEAGEPSAYVDGHGYNSATARTELATRTGFTHALRELGLEQYSVAITPVSSLGDWEPDELVFIKPNRISDISENPRARAQLVRTANLTAELAESFLGGTVLQRPEQLMSAQELAAQLGLVVDVLDPSVNYLHTLRVFTPLWLPAHQTPAIELRLTDSRSDIGKQFATTLKLLEPELVFSSLPQLAELHNSARSAFAVRYGEQNYLAFDYLVCSDGSVKILNGLARALTPNLEGQAKEVQHLANVTADVEVKQLAKLALGLAG